MRTKRQGLIVWFKHMKNTRHIKRFGHLVHSSKRLKYAVLYADQDSLDQTEAELLKLPFIISVERSQKPFVQTNFENAKPDKAKQYDYKMDI
ncbi:YlbG family protein [Lentibacillus halophilus]|uniref:YlbG family protein n=1 Tax=Lentibacillus halophilus TaxID=295065 RepID=A0ABN0ZFS1_9BACI